MIPLTVDFTLANGSTLSLTWPFLALLGVVIGLLTGLFGVGGGFLLTPCLNIIFGVPFPNAVGSDLAQIFVTGSTSAFKHYRRRNVDIRLGTHMALAACLGTLLGKMIMDYLSKNAGTVELLGHSHSILELVLKGLFLFLMIAVMTSILREKTPPKAATTTNAEASEDAEAEATEPETQKNPTTDNSEEEEVSTAISQWLRTIRIPPIIHFDRSGIKELSLWVPLCISLTVGIMTGLMGVGGGFVLFPLLVYVIGVPTAVAVGTSAFQIVFATGLGTLTYWSSGQVWWTLVASLLGGSLIGVQIGVFASQKLGGKRIRRYFAFVIGVGIMVIIYSLIRTFVFGDIGGNH